MDSASSVASGLNVADIILALFLLALTALGALVMVFGTNIRGDIKKLFEKLDEHAQMDIDSFKDMDRRLGRQAQRLTKLDGRTEDG